MPKLRSAPESHHEDITRAVIAGAAVAALFAAAFGIGAGWHTPSREKAAARTGEGHMTTGAIVYVPVHGDTCRQSLIDNNTGKITHGAAVSCKEALAASARRSGGGSTRIDVIRESFRGSTP